MLTAIVIAVVMAAVVMHSIGFTVGRSTLRQLTASVYLYSSRTSSTRVVGAASPILSR